MCKKFRKTFNNSVNILKNIRKLKKILQKVFKMRSKFLIYQSKNITT